MQLKQPTKDKMRFVTAFNRDRDSYQLPLALNEGGKLERLVTDLYLPDAWAGSDAAHFIGLAHRACPGISSSMVRCSAKVVWLQLVLLRFARNAEERSRVFNAIDSTLSRIAGREGAKAGAGLFLYSGYALEAFSMFQNRNARKLLFVYHPQGDYVRGILEADAAIHPEAAVSHQAHLQEIRINEGDRVGRELDQADALVCASSFTAASVRARASCRDKLLRVVPYGCLLPSGFLEQAEGAASRREVRVPRVLFVGQGVQRKGLHHLLKAWRSGSLWRGSELTLVLSSLDPGIERLVAELPVSPRMLTRLSRSELDAEYRRADIFALPSLVEGFGLVYLEALSAGCHVVGTPNTGLPDLNAPGEAASLVPPGNIEALRQVLENAIEKASRREFSRSAIKCFAETRSWEAFRMGIRSFVSEAESDGGACPASDGASSVGECRTRLDSPTKENTHS